ncbi:hypothetical protein BH11BAC3_BH11BAC3_47980 [soil metagenome]
MIFSKQFISFISVMLLSTGCFAQDSGFVYRDTSIVEIETQQTVVDTNDEEVNADEEETDVFYVDTVLRHNELAILPDSMVSLKKMKDFAYAKNLDSLLNAYQNNQNNAAVPKEEPSWLQLFFSSKITTYVFWAIAVIFIVFVLSKLFITEGFFQRSYKKAPVKILEDDSEQLSHTTDYGKLIGLAVSQQNYRLAIRYLYLQTLQKLTTKGVITFAPDKTNYEYVQELNGKNYKNEFAALTLNYEYAWYGAFDIDEKIFAPIQHKFKQFNSVLL